MLEFSFLIVTLLSFFLPCPSLWAKKSLYLPKVGQGKNIGLNERVYSLLVERINKSENFEVLSIDEDWPKDFLLKEDEADLELLDKARKSYSIGKDHYENGRFSDGLEALREAVTTFENNLRHLKEKDDYIDSLLFYALSYLALDDTANAQDQFNKVITIEPAITLDANLYPPKVVSFFQEQKKTILSGEKGALKITITNIPDPQVYIDGESTTTFIRNIVAGQHYLVITKPGFIPFAKYITINPGREVIEFELKPQSTAKLGKFFLPLKDDAEPPARKVTFLTEFAQMNKLRYILLLAMEKLPKHEVGLTVQLYDAKHTEYAKSMTAGFHPSNDDPVSELTVRLDNCLDKRGYVLPVCKEKTKKISGGAGTKSGEIPLVEQHDPFYKKWWFITATGITLASGVLVIVVLFVFTGSDNGKNGGKCTADSDDPYCIAKDTDINAGIVEINVPPN